MAPHIAVDQEAIARFFRRNHFRRLALFSSVLREDVGGPPPERPIT